MSELKKIISRSFTRKVNLGNYESADFWASYSEEVPADTEDPTCTRISAILYGNAKSDVEQAIIDYKREQFKETPKDKSLSTYEHSSEVYE